jgi:hypothetical protein
MRAEGARGGVIVNYGMKNIDGIVALAKSYQIYVNIRDNAHYQMALRLRRQERLLGIPVIILTTVVGTAIFASLQNQTAVGWKIATGLLSVLAATLAALQTFFGFSGEAGKHESVSVGYAQLRRRFDSFILSCSGERAEKAAAIADWQVILKEMDRLEEKSPRIINSVWEKSRREVAARIGQ